MLIVRLGSLGDIVHALPAVAALREAHPGATIDWLVDRRALDIAQLVTVIDRVVVLERPTLAGWLAVLRILRQTRYDVAIDLQGLLKSAVLARASGARRVLGFSHRHLRERSSRWFYSETVEPSAGHVIAKNISLVASLGARVGTWRFPLTEAPSPALGAVRARVGARFALVNPGAAWPNKRWPSDRFGAVARFLRERYGWPSIVLWGPAEEALAREVVAASAGAATLAPPTSIADLLALSREAALMVSGDTGPLHIAGAVGTPLVGLFGPTDPGRNGPWASGDRTVSRHDACDCAYQRQCRRRTWCLADITVEEVTRAVEECVS
jgi:lipopolysaccharide heptosyltransferase I